MNDYFIRMIPYILIVAVPCLGFINEKWAIPFRLFPTFAGLRMLLNSFGNPVGGKLFSDFLILLAWCLVLYLPVKKKFEKQR